MEAKIPFLFLIFLKNTFRGNQIFVVKKDACLGFKKKKIQNNIQTAFSILRNLLLRVSFACRQIQNRGRCAHLIGWNWSPSLKLLKKPKQMGSRHMTKCSSGDKDLKLLFWALARDSCITLKVMHQQRDAESDTSPLSYINKKCTKEHRRSKKNHNE